MPFITLQSQDKIAETLLIPLHARAIEARRSAPMLEDKYALQLVEQIDVDFSRFKLASHDLTTIIMRLCEFDLRAREFMNRHPCSVVVHIGCGLDTRFERVDNGSVEWYDLDLPEVIAFRKKLIPQSDRCHVLGCSIFDPTWIERVNIHPGRTCLFIAEGVFPYFTRDQVEGLFLLLKENFRGCELVCDGMTPAMVYLHNLKLIFSKLDARLGWGLKDGREPESWSMDIRMLDEWFYFDKPEPRLGPSQWMRYIPLFARGVGIFHYKLGNMDR